MEVQHTLLRQASWVSTGVTQFAPQVSDLIAQPGRVLELQCPGGLVHLFFERLDET